MAGFWGPITANYDWCENNYVISYYIAEFFNTLSSFPIALAGLSFVRVAIRNRYGAPFVFAGLGLFVVGVGSIAFHGTLLREGQVLDEVPMLWSSLAFLWLGTSLRMGCAADSMAGLRVGAGLGLYGLASTAVYFGGGFEYFIISYALTVAAIAIISAIHVLPRRDAVAFPMVIFALVFYVGGMLLLWLPEQVLCGNRLVNHSDSGLLRLPIPLHAFFHLTSSAGPLCWLTFAVYEAMRLAKRGPQLVFEPSSEFCGMPVPVVVSGDHQA